MLRSLSRAASAAGNTHGWRPTGLVGRALWAALLCVMAPAVIRAQAGSTVAPARIDPFANRAVVTYIYTNGIADSALAEATVALSRQAGLSITGPFAMQAAPGDRRVFAHTLANQGNQDDVIQLGASAPAGWTLTLYLDTDGDGLLSAADTRITAPLAIARGGAVALLAVFDVPANAPDSSLATLVLTATSTNDPRAVVSTSDRVTVIVRPAPRPNVTLVKSVDRADATLGDTLTYTLRYTNAGDADAAAPVLLDTLPRNTRYVAGSLTLNGVRLSDAADADAGTVSALPDGRAVANVMLPAIAPAGTGVVTVRVVVGTDAPDGPMPNVATLSYGDVARTIALTASATVSTRITTAVIALSEQIVGAVRLVVGSTVHLRLTYANVSGTAALNTVVRDSLPASLAFVSSVGGTANGSIVTWSIGTLAANSSAVLDLYARVVARPAGDSLSDLAIITADNARSRQARVSLIVTAFTGHDLKIAKTAGVLNAAIGEAIPYAVTITNTNTATLRRVVVRDLLPEGTRFSPGTPAGVDSVDVQGNVIAFHLAAPLAGGASATVRYAAVVANPAAGADLVNRATADAEDGLVVSDTARAVVTQRRAFGMRERTIIGKVWLDRNANGVQDAGEEGVAGAQVWDANGDVVVTDKEGRYSFRNVTTGTHALRLDPIAIPAGFGFPSRADEVVVVQADGWTMPRTSIRLIPRRGVASPSACDCLDSVRRTPAMPVVLASSAAPATVPVAPVSVTPLLGAAERAEQARAELIVGPSAHFTAPADGSVMTASRFYVGVRGAAGSHVRLLDGDTFLREGTLRGDGRQDFINVELGAGPHHLRVLTAAADLAAQSDSIMVHVSGVPARFLTPAEVPVLRGDATAAVAVRVRVTDRWNVPVVGAPMITVDVRGATVDAPDADASSVGLQLRTDAQGWLTIPLRAAHAVGTGELRLTADKASVALPLHIFASVRPLLATGVGQLGLGSAPGAFGALTLQGAVTEQTSVTVTYDSRRADAQNQFFQQGSDPLGEDRFQTFGDNSQTRSVAPSARALSARIDRGMDWVAAGDVQTQGFGRDGELGAYRRSVTGASAQLTTGALTWHTFGSMTHQALERRQVRADGSTGPYLVGADIRAGTEQIAIEVRAADNAARVIVHQALSRTADYQIDYASGVVLLRLPVPSADPSGNPVFVVATVERNSAGAAHFVGGARIDANAAQLLGLGGRVLDTLTIGFSGVRDGAASSSALPGASSATHLFNADLRLRRGGFALGAGVLRAQSPDSVGTAISATTRYALADDRLAIDGRFTSVGEGMGSADPRLASALDEMSLGLTTRFGAANTLRLHHDRTHFSQFGVDRSATGLTADQQLMGRHVTQDVRLVSERLAGAAGASSALTARVTTSVSPAVDTWIDGSHSLLSPAGSAAASRPDQIGTGVTLHLPAGLQFEASHRITKPADSAATSVTSGQLRADGILGGALWTGFESSTGLNDEVRGAHSALFGWSERQSLGAGWQVTSMFERRVGLSRVATVDPSRALPFAQPEADRWSAAAGLGWNPVGDRARLALNSELQNSVSARSMRVQLTGDAALNAGLALITLHDWSSRHDASRLDGLGERTDDRSVFGLALRPVTTERFNALAKMEWRRTINPAGDALRTANTRDERLISAADAVWAPMRGTELTMRYALRFATMNVGGDSAQRVSTADHFAGTRFERVLGRGFSARADGRLLMETRSGLALWNAAPSAVYDFQGRIQIEGGYRFGALRDPDFANVGGAGAFATAGFRFTEQALANPAAFWRSRLAADR